VFIRGPISSRRPPPRPPRIPVRPQFLWQAGRPLPQNRNPTLPQRPAEGGEGKRKERAMKAKFILPLLFAATVTAALIYCHPARAAHAQESPSVDQILEKYIQALGGREALQNIKSVVSKGVFYIPQFDASGDVELYRKAPDLYLFVGTFDGYGTVRRAFDGKVAWADDPQMGLADLPPSERETLRRGGLTAPLRMTELFQTVTVKGKEKVGGRDAWVLEAVPEAGKPELHYYDTETGLLLKINSEQSNPQGAFRADTFFEDYREVEGVKMAFTTRQDSTAFSFTLRTTEVQVNVEVDDARFARPR
jgi:hypothetical protein